MNERHAPVSIDPLVLDDRRPLSPRRRRRWGRTAIKYSITAVSALALAAIGWGGAVSAAPPEVVLDDEFEFMWVSPAATDPCGVETAIHEVGSVRITEFVDGAGEPKRAHIHVHGTTHLSSAFGEVVDRWSYNLFLDAETLTNTYAGNVFNVHAGPGGVLVNDSGRLVIDITTGEATVVNGPHQSWFGDVEDACAVLAP